MVDHQLFERFGSCLERLVGWLRGDQTLQCKATHGVLFETFENENFVEATNGRIEELLFNGHVRSEIVGQLFQRRSCRPIG